MARRKDLTALAALGTLGYMLSKRGDKKDDKKDDKKTEEYRADPFGAMSQAERDARPSMEELDQRERGNEQGKVQASGDASVAEAYSGPRTKPIVTATTAKPAARRPVVKSRPMSAADEAAFQEANEAPSGSRYTSTKDFMGISNVPRRNSYYRKGGAVKGYASGGMTSSSASKRADGIATKGKTRGKIC